MKLLFKKKKQKTKPTPRKDFIFNIFFIIIESINVYSNQNLNQSVCFSSLRRKLEVFHFIVFYFRRMMCVRSPGNKRLILNSVCKQTRPHSENLPRSGSDDVHSFACSVHGFRILPTAVPEMLKIFALLCFRC